MQDPRCKIPRPEGPDGVSRWSQVAGPSRTRSWGLGTRGHDRTHFETLSNLRRALSPTRSPRESGQYGLVRFDGLTLQAVFSDRPSRGPVVGLPIASTRLTPEAFFPQQLAPRCCEGSVARAARGAICGRATSDDFAACPSAPRLHAWSQTSSEVATAGSTTREDRVESTEPYRSHSPVRRPGSATPPTPSWS